MSAINELLVAYRAETTSPADHLVREQQRLCAHPAAVIARVDLQPHLERLAGLSADLPLFGIPFVIKDNIDLAGVPTTAACPGYAFTPDDSAHAVALLLAAGAVPLAKVNLDQFATGLVGTRSPFGTPLNPLLPEHIPGGSSSGSAVAVSIGAALFALGTDTAGSGRVPAAACNIVGLKPTKGRVSTRGVVPACRSLDCVSVFATSVHDAALVGQVLSDFDVADPFARSAPAPQTTSIKRLGILTGDDLVIDAEAYRQGYAAAGKAASNAGCSLIPTPYTAFAEAADLLYGGPWVAERTAAVGAAIAAGIDGLDPTVAGIISGGTGASAIDAFQASYALAEKRRQADAIWDTIDALLLPTIPGLPTLADVAADPVGVNTRLGTYTNFVNLLDCCGVTIPVLDDDGALASVTLIAPAWQEDRLCGLAATIHEACTARVGAGTQSTSSLAPPAIDAAPPVPTMPLAVVGAHLAGQPLHHQLTSLGATLREATTTAARYQLIVVPESDPAKPGLIRRADGQAIAVEVYDLPVANWAAFISNVSQPLAIGSLELADGSWVHGFVCEGHVADGAEDISQHGGWRQWLAST